MNWLPWTVILIERLMNNPVNEALFLNVKLREVLLMTEPLMTLSRIAPNVVLLYVLFMKETL